MSKYKTFGNTHKRALNFWNLKYSTSIQYDVFLSNFGLIIVQKTGYDSSYIFDKI